MKMGNPPVMNVWRSGEMTYIHCRGDFLFECGGRLVLLLRNHPRDLTVDGSFEDGEAACFQGRGQGGQRPADRFLPDSRAGEENTGDMGKSGNVAGQRKAAAQFRSHALHMDFHVGGRGLAGVVDSMALQKMGRK